MVFPLNQQTARPKIGLTVLHPNLSHADGAQQNGGLGVSHLSRNSSHGQVTKHYEWMSICI